MTTEAARLNVLIPTRGRPYQLAASIYSLWLLASDKNTIQFCVACDDDDAATQEALRDIRAKVPLFVRIGPRPETLGSVANDLSDHWPADAYVVWADDLMCATYGWDEEVARALRETPHGVFWWTAARDVATFVPIVSNRWRMAAGRVFTEHFPFWYDDLWLQEVWCMATDTGPISLPIKVVDKPHGTQRMRELRFWHDFYTFMRAERVREGKRIAAALGMSEPIIGAELARRLQEMSVVSDEFLSGIEKTNHAETDAPSESYLAARARAEGLMKRAA